MDNNTSAKVIIGLRIVSIIVLIVIAVSIIYFRFGYSDPDDSYILDKIGRNVSCKQAMIYYAENEWGLDLSANPLIYNLNKSVPIS